MQCCALIPAAGNGSRLGLPVPKLLAPIHAGNTVWTLLSRRLRGLVDHIHVVASPAGQEAIERAVRASAVASMTSVGIQRRPAGMGDAVFCGRPVWQLAKTVLVVWGDQVHVSAETLHSAVALHDGTPQRVVLPLAEVDGPYVAYGFDRCGRLRRVLQRREGDACPPRASSDVGTFALSTRGLAQAWADYGSAQPRGALTGEVNFLPFLVYLAGRDWDVLTYRVRDPLETRGINTRSDLRWIRTLHRHTADEHATSSRS
jgi:bifunctional UDP-N-acetylglucosamine pyrophosphorylase / glucosamine-1-phosphate N-acetyltransferase